MNLRRIKTAFRIPPRRYVLLVRVIGLSVQAWYMDRFKPGVFLPERWLDASLRIPSTDSDISRIKDISWAIRIAASITPWENVCRHQAWQGAIMLNRYGISFSYFVGAKKSPEGKVEGHSWILAGNRFVSGKCNVREYTILKQFH